MTTTRWTRVFLAAALGALTAAHTEAQQDSNDYQPTPRLKIAPGGGGLAGPQLRLRGPGTPADGPRLGVMVEQTPDGLRITEVLDGSLAQAAGLQATDIVLRIGDEHIRTVADVQQALSACHPGDTVQVAAIRQGEGIVLLSAVMPEPPAPVPAEEAPAAPPVAQVDGFRGGFLGVQLPPAQTDASATPDGSAPGTDATSAAGPGVEVAGVVPDSAAWYAGLQEGDRLLAIDGTALSTSEDLVGAVSSREPGTAVELKYLRDGSERTTTVRLGNRAPQGPADLFGSMPGDLAPGMRSQPLLRGPHGGSDFKRQGLAPQGPWTLTLPFRGGRGAMPHGAMPPGAVDRFLQDFDLGSSGAQQQSVQIEMRDGQGTMTVTRDGKTETYTLDGNGRWVRDDAAGSPATPPATEPGNTQDS